MGVFHLLLAANSPVVGSDISSGLPSLIETIILAKVSALVIIFSTIFLVSQLVSTRYSPEFTAHFLELDIFKYSFIIGIGIILVDIVFRIILPGVSPDIALLIMGTVIVLFILFSYMIYNFVSDMLSRSTPSYLLETYARNLSKSKYMSKSIDSYDKNSMNLHPLQPLYDMGRNAVKEAEYAVAKNSEMHLRQSSIDLLEDIQDNDLDEMAVSSDTGENVTLRQHKWRVLFETPFDHYFSSLSRISAENDYEMLSRSPNQSISDIGEKGVRNSWDELTEMAFLSIYNETIVKSPESVEKSSTHYARLQGAVQAQMDLMETTVEEDSLELYCYLNTMGYEVMRGVEARVEEGPFEESHPINTIIGSQVEVYKKLIKSHERYYSEQNLNLVDILGRKMAQGDAFVRDYYGFEHPDPRISALIVCRTLIFSATNWHLRRSDWLDDETVLPHTINFHWRDLVEFASNHVPKSSGVLIAQRYIEMNAYHSLNDDIGIHASSDMMVLAGNANFEVLEEAFQQIYNPEERDYDLVEYDTYRGLGRLLTWTGIPNKDYSDEFLDVVREFHIRAKRHYYMDMKRKSFRALKAYVDKKKKGKPLPNPSEYSRQSTD